MKTSDLQLRQHVEDELLWDPSLPAASIGVAVRDAVVTLTGKVETYAQKQAAAELVSHIRGVRAVADELEVRLAAESQRSDDDMAHRIDSIFTWNATIPRDRIQVQVKQGWVTLEGSVEWHFQRSAAEDAIRGLMGVKGITNSIAVQPGPVPRNAKTRLEAALARQGMASSKELSVIVDENTILLSGPVLSPAVREAIERLAWKTPGIERIQNELRVEPGEAIEFAEST